MVLAQHTASAGQGVLVEGYLGRHWYDVLVIVLPLLRPLRLLRLIPLLSVLNGRAQTGLRGRVAIYVAGGAPPAGLRRRHSCT